MKYLTVKGLIKELKKYDENLPVIITDDGKGDSYGIHNGKWGIGVVDGAYFGNDPDAGIAFGSDIQDEDGEYPKMKFLNLITF